MRVVVGNGKSIELARGDITKETTDAVVNSANADLLPGGGVCGAIFRAAGPLLERECREIRAERGPLQPGEAVATSGAHLPARYVIHALGPVWSGGSENEAELLAFAYREAILRADELGLESIAFPSISTGIFGFPVHLAAPVALTALRDTLAETAHVRLARLVFFDDTTYRAYLDAATRLNLSARTRHDHDRDQDREGNAGRA